MKENNTVKISDVKELYSILPKEFRKEFAIGIHGFDGGGRYYEQVQNGEYKLNQSKIQETKRNILSDGLKFPPKRKLLSTVSFDNLSSYITTKGEYDAGGIIIALPKVLKSESGEEMFIGSPNEKSVSNQQWDRNIKPTSLSEVILPEEGVLNPMFIMGTYTKNDKGIEVSLNQEHIVFSNGLVSNEYFKIKQAKFLEMMENGEIDKSIIDETNRQKQNKMISLMALGQKSYQHFGNRIAEKLKETVGILKTKFLEKNNDRTEDLTNGR